MQTTLLGTAIAIILALLAALVGPLLIDWSRFRAEFEARSAETIGLKFRINGHIDARLLPTPSVVLHDIEFGQDDSKVRARALRIEYALGSLLRGEWRIDDASLEGPEVEIGLDAAGRVLWPLPSDGGFSPKELSIRQLSISDGRITLLNAAGSSHFTLDKLDFTGTIRSMLGPVQGDGAFISAGRRYPFRIGLGRVGDGGRAPLHVSVDQIDGLKANVDLGDLARAPDTSLRRQCCTRSRGRTCASRRRRRRTLASDLANQRRQHGGGDRADRTPIRGRRSGDQTARRRQGDLRQPTTA